MTIYELTQNALYLQNLLEEGEIDEQVYKDSIESMCAENKLESICMVIRNLEHKAGAFKAEIDRMAARKKTLENSVNRLKNSMMEYMQASNQDKVEAGVFALSLGKSKSVNIWDVTLLPDEYLLPQDPKIDKIAIGKALKSGEAVDGAELTESSFLKIR